MPKKALFLDNLGPFAGFGDWTNLFTEHHQPCRGLLSIGGQDGNDIHSIAHSGGFDNNVVLPVVEHHRHLLDGPGGHIKETDLRLLRECG